MESSSPPPDRRALTGAVFLMATSAIGPGFLTQTTVFTMQLGAAFGFAILVSIALDIGAQSNLWQRIIAEGRRAQEIAQSAIPGTGLLLTALILFGGFAFNIGNLSGTGLGLHALTGIPVKSEPWSARFWPSACSWHPPSGSGSTDSYLPWES